jgi:hypothetical protein
MGWEDHINALSLQVTDRNKVVLEGRREDTCKGALGSKSWTWNGG